MHLDVLADFRDEHAPQHGAVLHLKASQLDGHILKVAMSRAHDSVLPAHLGLAARSPRKLHTHNFHVHMHNTHANLFLPGTLA